MGITGLLKGLQCVSQKQNICDFSGKTLAIDASSWLHKSVYSISEKYVESTYNNNNTLDPACVRASVKYVSSRCTELIRHAKIRKLYLVLDGERCPLKAVTNAAREERRQQNIADARHYKAKGRNDKAQEKYKSCIKVYAALANAVALNVQEQFASSGGRVVCVMSPYEADAQLVKLCVDGIADGVVTEDSDVLVYFAACRVSCPILFKLDRNSGSCDVITMEWLFSPSSSSLLEESAAGNKKGSSNSGGGTLVSVLRSLSSRESRRPGLGVRLFVQACVLTGCDYAPSQLSGVGLVTAFKLLRDQANRPCGERFRHVLASLAHKKLLQPSSTPGSTNDQFSMTEQYEELLAKSEAVFYYHPVLQESSGSVVTLTTPRIDDSQEVSTMMYSPSLERFKGDWSFLGKLGSFDKQCYTTTDESIEQCENVPISEIIVKRPSKNCKTRATKTAVGKKRRGAYQPIERTVINPYKSKATKKKRTQETALSQVDTNQRRESHLNQFVAFEYGGEENEPDPGMYQQNRQDVRFVKPKFSKDGRKKPQLAALKSESKRRASSVHSPAREPSLNRSNCAQIPPRASAFENKSHRTGTSPVSDDFDFYVQEEFEIASSRSGVAIEVTEPFHSTLEERVSQNTLLPVQDTTNDEMFKDTGLRIVSESSSCAEGGSAIDDAAPVVYTIGDDHQLENHNKEGAISQVNKSFQPIYEEGLPQDAVILEHDTSDDEILEEFENTAGPRKTFLEPSSYATGDPVDFAFSDGPQFEYKEEDERHSKYWSKRNVRRVTRSPSYHSSNRLEETSSIDDVSNGVDCCEPPSVANGERDEMQIPSFEARAPLDLYVKEAPSVYSCEDDRDKIQIPVFEESDQDFIQVPVFEERAPLDSGFAKQFDRRVAKKNHRTPYQSGADWIERQSSAFSQDSNDERIDIDKFTTPFEASQARGLRSLGFETKQQKNRGPLDGYFQKQANRNTPGRPASARRNRASQKHRGTKQRSGSSLPSITHFFKPIVTVDDSDDDF